MNKKRSFGVVVIIILFTLISISSVITFVHEIVNLGMQHNLFRIIDIFIRGLGFIFSVIAIFGLWKMKLYGYYAGILASCFEILLRLLIFVPAAKVPSEAFPEVHNLAILANILGIIIFLIVVYYLNKYKKSFIE